MEMPSEQLCVDWTDQLQEGFYCNITGTESMLFSCSVATTAT